MVLDLPSDTKSDSWVIANIQHSGWYRVNYDEANWRLIINQLQNNHSLIHPINRAQLLDDSFNLGRTGLVPQTLFLNICKSLSNDADPIVLKKMFTILDYFLKNSEGYTFMKFYIEFEEFYMNLLLPVYKRIAWSRNITDLDRQYEEINFRNFLNFYLIF